MLSRRIGEARRQGERDLARAATALRGILRERGARVQRSVPADARHAHPAHRRSAPPWRARPCTGAGGIARRRTRTACRVRAQRGATDGRPDRAAAESQADRSPRLCGAATRRSSLRLERLRGRLNQADRLLATQAVATRRSSNAAMRWSPMPSGNVVKRAAEVAAGMAMAIRFADGTVRRSRRRRGQGQGGAETACQAGQGACLAKGVLF